MVDTVGARIRERRTALGWTQGQLSDATGIPRATLANYELGRRDPDPKTLIFLAQALNTSVAYLLGETDDPSPPAPGPRNGRPEAQLAYFLRGTGRLTERDIRAIVKLFEELSRSEPESRG